MRVTGRYSFMTGCVSADFVGGLVPLPASDGQPARMVVALARAEEAQVERTWDPVGLAGTSSHDVIFDNIFVPQERIFVWPDSRPNVSLPTAVFVTGIWFISMCAAGTHLGLARRALDEVRIELDGKRDRYTGQLLIEGQSLLERLEEAEGLFYVCHAGVKAALDAIWACGQRGEKPTDDTLINARLACVTAVHQGATIVQTAYALGGAGRAGVLQGLLRDASCLIHHVSTNRASLETVGRFRAGLDPLD